MQRADQTLRLRHLFVLVSVCIMWTNVGCSRDNDPALAAMKFAAAARGGQGSTIVPMLTEKSRSLLLEEAQRASNQIGDRRSVAVFEMLQIVDVPDLDGRRRPEILQLEADFARVAVFGLDGESYPIDLIRENGEWRVPLLESS